MVSILNSKSSNGFSSHWEYKPKSWPWASKIVHDLIWPLYHHSALKTSPVSVSITHWLLGCHTDFIVISWTGQVHPTLVDFALDDSCAKTVFSQDSGEFTPLLPPDFCQYGIISETFPGESNLPLPGIPNSSYPLHLFLSFWYIQPTNELHIFFI